MFASLIILIYNAAIYFIFYASLASALTKITPFPKLWGFWFIVSSPESWNLISLLEFVGDRLSRQKYVILEKESSKLLSGRTMLMAGTVRPAVGVLTHDVVNPCICLWCLKERQKSKWVRLSTRVWCMTCVSIGFEIHLKQRNSLSCLCATRYSAM